VVHPFLSSNNGNFTILFLNPASTSICITSATFTVKRKQIFKEWKHQFCPSVVKLSNILFGNTKLRFLNVEISRNVHAEYIHSRNIPSRSTSGRQQTHCMSSFDRAKDQSSDVECDVLNLEKSQVRNTYNYRMWD